MTPELVEKIPETAAFGTCFLCNTECTGPYVNLHREVWEGDITIGRPCYEELIRICGGATETEVADTEIKHQREVKRLNKNLQKLNGRIKKLGSVRA